MKPVFKKSFNGYDREEVDAWCLGFSDDFEKQEKRNEALSNELVKLRKEHENLVHELEKSKNRERIISLELPKDELLKNFSSRHVMVIENSHVTATDIVEQASQYASAIELNAENIINEANRQAKDIINEAKGSCEAERRRLEQERSEWERQLAEEKAELTRLKEETDRLCEKRYNETVNKVDALAAEAKRTREEERTDFDIAQKARREGVDREVQRVLTEANATADKIMRDAQRYVDRIEGGLTPAVLLALQNAAVALNKAQLEVSELPSTKNSYNSVIAPARDETIVEDDGEE